MRRAAALILVGVLLLPFGYFVWGEWYRHYRLPAPDEWREFARQAKGDEFEDLALDYTRFNIERFRQFNAALARCDEEAFLTAGRLYPLIRGGAHPSEELFEALAASLSVCPGRTIVFIRGTDIPLEVICEWSDRSARGSVKAQLDAGNDEVHRCLAAMGDELPTK